MVTLANALLTSLARSEGFSFGVSAPTAAAPSALLTTAAAFQWRERYQKGPDIKRVCGPQRFNIAVRLPSRAASCLVLSPFPWQQGDYRSGIHFNLFSSIVFTCEGIGEESSFVVVCACLHVCLVCVCSSLAWCLDGECRALVRAHTQDKACRAPSLHLQALHACLLCVAL